MICEDCGREVSAVYTLSRQKFQNYLGWYDYTVLVCRDCLMAEMDYMLEDTYC